MGQPKALIRVGGRTLLGHLLHRAQIVGCSPIIVVSGAHDLDAVLNQNRDRMREIHNDHWQLGQLSSVQIALSKFDQSYADCSGAIVFTVDRPFVKDSTIEALLSHHRSNPEFILQPCSAGRRGHPILIPKRWFSDWLALAPQESTRVLFLRSEIQRARHCVEVEDKAIFDNFDRREDFEGIADVEF